MLYTIHQITFEKHITHVYDVQNKPYSLPPNDQKLLKPICVVIKRNRFVPSDYLITLDMFCVVKWDIHIRSIYHIE